MKFVRTFIASSVTVIGIVGVAPAFAGDPTAPRTATVRFDELDLASNQGASELYARLRAASRQVCATLDGRELRQQSAYQACYKQALSSAVLHVNRSNVTALHARATQGSKAS